jgi:hypothetical protein
LATSGSYNYQLTASNIITEAAENLGIIEAGGTVPAHDAATLLRSLNIIVKEHSGSADGATGVKNFHRQRVHLFLTPGQSTYEIGPTSARATTLYGKTTLTTAASSGASAFLITSNEDETTFPGTTVTMTNADYVGIEQSDGTVHWTTISGTPGASMSTADSSTADASAGATVWWFTSKSQRLLEVESALLRDSEDTDTPLEIYKEAKQYDQGIADKLADGQPGALLVEYLRTTTRVTFNSQPDDSTHTVVLTGLYPAEDYDADEDIAFPQEWFGFLALEVTLRSCPKYGVKWTQEMQLNYKLAEKRALGTNPENTLLYFQCGEAG